MKVYDCSSVLCVICEVSWQNRQLTLKRSCPQNTAGFKRLVFYYTICQFSATPLLAIDGPVKIVSTYVGHHCVKCTVRAAHQDFKMPFYPKNFLESAEPLKMTCIHTHQFQIHTTHEGILSGVSRRASWRTGVFFLRWRQLRLIKVLIEKNLNIRWKTKTFLLKTVWRGRRMLLLLLPIYCELCKTQ